MTAALADPAELPRRSPVYRRLVEAGARFEVHADAAVAVDFGDRARERAAAERCGLADLSTLPRCGFKGAGTVDWLRGQGLIIPEDSNRAQRQADGTLAARLSPAEVLLLADPFAVSERLQRLGAAWAATDGEGEGPRGHPLPRQDSHAWFVLCGGEAAPTFAKVCAVDLRPAKFAAGSIAQTVAARVSVVVIRDDLGATLAYHVLVDSASAQYLWDCLTDAMAEFDGAPVGLAALRDLAGA